MIIDMLIILHIKYWLTLFNNSEADRVFLSSYIYVASSLQIQFHRLSPRDSGKLIIPFIPAYN